MYANDAWIVLAVAPLSSLLVLVPFFIDFRSRRHRVPITEPTHRIRTSHYTPFHPYSLEVARAIAIEHADCPSNRCGAKASAMSVLTAAGLTCATRGHR